MAQSRAEEEHNLLSDNPYVEGCEQGAGPLWTVSMVIAVSPRVPFNLRAAEISQRGSASATRGATAKPLVAEVCILTR